MHFYFLYSNEFCGNITFFEPTPSPTSYPTLTPTILLLLPTASPAIERTYFSFDANNSGIFGGDIKHEFKSNQTVDGALNHFVTITITDGSCKFVCIWRQQINVASVN